MLLLLPRSLGYPADVKVAGLDVGWHRTVDLAFDGSSGKHAVQQPMLPGRYPFKFIIDGQWTYCMEYPTYMDGTNINNFVEVVPLIKSPEKQAQQARLLSVGGKLTPQERTALVPMVDAHA